MKEKRFTKGRINSFRYAFSGIRLLFREANTWIHLAVAVLVVLAGIYFGLSRVEWLFVAISIGLVFTAEAFNTAIEKLCDTITTNYNESIKRTKDLAAAAVLLISITAAIIGLIIFIPKLMLLF